MIDLPVLNFQDFISEDGDALVTNSLKVSAVHGKRHDNVVALTRKRMKEAGEWGHLNFKEVEYMDAKGELRPMFMMTKLGYAFLSGKLAGKKAVQHQLAFINAFDDMERYIKNQKDGLMYRHFALQLEHKNKKERASICGKGLQDWKGDKRVIESAMTAIEEKMNPPLFIVEQAA